MAYYNVDDMTKYIRDAAVKRGIDPSVALRVARGEGLARNTWQSNLKGGKLGIREPSYGPFQLLVGGGKTGYGLGMGNDFMKATGLDPSDPKNAYATVDFALDQAVKGGWGPWYGAKAAGITGKHGIDPSAKPLGLSLNSGYNPGSIPRGMMSDENLGIKPLDPGVEVASRGTFNVADTPPVSDVNESVDFGGMLKGLDFNNPSIGKGLNALASAFGGGGGSDEQEAAHQTPIPSSLGAEAQADASRAAAAQQMMAQLMDRRSRGGLRPRGLSLMG